MTVHSCHSKLSTHCICIPCVLFQRSLIANYLKATEVHIHIGLSFKISEEVYTFILELA